MPMLRTIERPMNATVPAVLVRGVEHLLHPVHVRGERGHDHPAAAPSAKIRSSTGPISRSGVTNPGISALVESVSSRSTPCGAEPGEPGQVGEPAVERQLVHLEVAGVQHHAGRRA